MNNALTPARCFFSFAAVLFLALFALGKDCGYFWDCIQQISREALWLYDNDWSDIFSRNFPGTGYHVPFMGMTTAALWHAFGKSVVISHVYALVWSAVLTFSLWSVVSRLASGWRAFAIGVLVLSLPTLLAQFFIASPDFIMLASFFMALAGLASRRMLFFSLGVLLLGLHNMRGAIASVCLVVSVALVWWRMRRSLLPLVWASMPSVVALGGYYVTRLVVSGWFLEDSNYSDHYVRPESVAAILHGVASLVLRMGENGQFIFWLLAVVVASRWLRARRALSEFDSVLALFVVSQVMVFVVFLLSTSMPFSNRYFLPLQVAAMLLVLPEVLRQNRARVVFFAVLVANLTGHLWVWPERMAQCWDGSMAHYGFYDLRDAVLQRTAETDGVLPDGSNVGAGFCFYFKEREFRPSHPKIIDVTSADSVDFYIYSNISNEQDAWIDELQDPSLWTPLFTERRGFVFATLYKRIVE